MVFRKSDRNAVAPLTSETQETTGEDLTCECRRRARASDPKLSTPSGQLPVHPPVPQRNSTSSKDDEGQVCRIPNTQRDPIDERSSGMRHQAGTACRHMAVVMVPIG
jgi:hypothetical protein